MIPVEHLPETEPNVLGPFSGSPRLQGGAAITAAIILVDGGAVCIGPFSQARYSWSPLLCAQLDAANCPMPDPAPSCDEDYVCAGGELAEGDTDADEVGLLTQYMFITAPLQAAVFDFAFLDDDAPTWYEPLLEEGRGLMDRGCTMTQMEGAIHSNWRCFRGPTFVADAEAQLNCVLRGLTAYGDSRVGQPEQGRPVRPLGRRELDDYGAKVVRVLRSLWYWNKCPQTMMKRACERHLTALGLRPILPADHYWREEQEKTCPQQIQVTYQERRCRSQSAEGFNGQASRGGR